MAKGLNKIQVGLTFTADTGNAKAQLKDLKRQIDNLQSATIAGTGITPLNRELTEALNASSRLKVALEQATNVDTGRLDLSKFSLQLKQSGMTMKDFSKHLTNLGPDGEKAFLQLAQSIVTAEVPMKRANAALEEMWTTMKNTARWQISSSVLHGFMGAVQSAYGYAQDLNESLNDIRIVTGYNTDQMAKFAKEANKAAKALSTTTTEYTNASLIYFQQGLNDQQVKERTDITVKMANVSKQSAETVSDQMTAVWNNFYDGSKSLEYYADVMTKLGAATASSSDEIAQGLEKFAAIADTVGLSYDYAASALATVTAETRQSADVVGTAFKTIFARIEGLSLGETLDDGTDLNKYSQALATVGVSIKDTNGDMKQMDQILEDLGSRWQTLGQDQKIALAQTVAGVRQYNQLIALMDNWDTFQENLNTAQGSEGALAAQAEIYAESWEAAQDRVTAAAEDIYSKLLNDEFFIDLTNNLADVIDGFSKLIDSMGGLPGLLTMIGGIAVRVFKNQIGESIDRMVYNLKVSTGLVKKETDKMRDETLKALTSFGGQSGYESKNLEVEFMKQQITLAYDLKEISENISKQDQEHIKNLIGMNSELQKSVVTTLELKEAQEEHLQELNKSYVNMATHEIVDSTYYNDPRTDDEKNDGVKLSDKEFANRQDIALKKVAEDKQWANKVGRVEANIDSMSSRQFDLDMFGELKEENGKIISSFMEESLKLGEEVHGWGSKDLEDLDRRVQTLGKKILEIQNLQKELDELDNNSELSEKDKRSKRNQLTRQIEEKMQYGQATLTQYYADTTKTSRARDAKKVQSFDKRTQNQGEESKKLLGEMISSSAKLTKQQRQSEKQQKSLAKSTQNLNKAFKNAAKATKSFGEKFVEISSSVSAISTGILSLKGAFDSLSDPDLSPLEKAQGFFMSIGMALPSLIAGLTDLAGGFGKTFKTLSSSNSVFEKFNNILKGQTDETKKLIVNKIMEQEITEETTEEEAKSIATKLLKEALQKEENEELSENLIKDTADLLLEKQKNGETVKTIGLKAAKLPLDKAENSIEQSTILTKIADIAATLGLKIATESLLWPITLLVIALGLLLIGFVAIVAVVANAAKAFGENAQATLDQAKANQELIDSNQELADSVENLIDEYNALKESGESTYDTMEKLKEQVPELIESYRELENSLAIDLNTGLMEAAARMAEITGNWDEFNRLMDEANEKVEEEEKDSYKSGSVGAGQLMADAGRKGSGNVKGTTYNNELGGWGANERGANKALREAFEEKGIAFDKNGNASTIVSLDTTDPTQMVNYYEALSAAKAKLEKEGDTESDTYREISEELNEMAEAYQEAKVQADEFLKLVAKDFEEKVATDYANIDTLEEYEKVKQAMIDNLAIAEGITKEEAKNIVETSEAFKGFEAALEGMDKFVADSGLAKEQITSIYDSFGSEDRKLFLQLDFTDYRGLTGEAALQAMVNDIEKLKDQMAISEIKADAKALGFDETAFESYADIVAETTEGVSKNSKEAYQLALNNARLNKGLQTLAESWKDNVTALQEANRDTYEYAEALGALRDAFEEAFGYKPSTEYIEGHLEEIGKLAQGDISVLDTLQDELAKDYVLNMEIGTAINEGSMSTAEVESQLLTILDSIDTSIELGEGSSISQDYLDTLQEMLDQGQITEEQMREAFRMKGIEMEVTGYKKVKGPSQTITQHIDGPGFLDYTKTITEDTEIEVPIINGDDSHIKGGNGGPASLSSGTASNAKFSKSYDANKINIDAIKDASGAKENEEKIKEIKEETDYYHGLERELAALEHQYNKISKAKDRAFGKERLRLIAEERKVWEQELKNAEDTKMEAQRVATEARNKLVNEFGLSYYKNTGELANYQEIYTREQQARIDAYKTGDEEAIKAADARWEEFQTLVQRYEQEGLEKIREAEINAIDSQNQIYDSYLEAIEYTVEVNLEVNEGDLEYIEYMLSKTGDDAFEAAHNINLLGDQTQALMDQSEIYNRGIDEIFANHGVTREQAAQMSKEELKALGFTDRELNSLKEYESGLLEVNTQLMENRKAVEDSLMPLYEAYGEEFDKLTAKVEYATNVMNNYKNIIDLLGKKRLGFDDEFLISMSKSQLEVSKNGLQIAKERLATAESSKAEAAAKLAQAEKALAADTGNITLQNDVAYWKQIYEELETDVMAQTENVMALTETALQSAQDHYTTLTDSILDEFDKGLSAIGDSMEQMMSKYEASEEVDSRYLESYEKMYELNKLSRKLEGDLAKTTSLQEQKSLVKLLDEVNAKKAEGIEMSEHDLKILQGQVEMEQARLAVEEAREAKTQVIRRRDSEGNWGYIYTANEEAAQDALQNYEDKVYELMDLNDEYLDDLGMKILEARQTMGEEIAALREEDFASQAEYEAAVDAIKEKYTSQINYYTDEMNKALGYNKDIYSQDITNRLHWYGESIDIGKEQLIAMAEIRESDYANQEEYFEALVQATGLTLEQIKELYHQGTLAHIEEISVQIGANEDLQTSFADTVVAQTTGFTTMDEFNDKLATSTEKMVERMDQAYKDYTEDIQGVIGTYEEFRDVVDQKINGEDGVVESSKKAEESATGLRETTEEQFGYAIDAVQSWQQAYSEEMDKVIAKNEESVKDILETWSKLKEIDYEVPVEDSGTEGGGSGLKGGNKKDSDKDYNPTSKRNNNPNNKPTASKTPYTTMKEDGTSVGKEAFAVISKSYFKGYGSLNNEALESENCFKDSWTNSWVVESKAFPGNYLWVSDMEKYYGMNGQPIWKPRLNAPYLTKSIDYYDTGGYTGEWGPEGRLAMLHQKEIVLNARDTENMLAMTQMVRDIAKQIDLTAVPTNRSIAPTAIASTNEGIEQNITIHAEFPDAVNQKEIEEAFNNLFIRVSQYANRKD